MESPHTGALPTQSETDFAESLASVARDYPSQSTSLQPNLIRLGDYQEVSGQLVALEENDEVVRIVLSVGTLEYPIGSREAEICQKTLSGEIGNRVSILRTPSTTDPIRIHIPISGE